MPRPLDRVARAAAASALCAVALVALHSVTTPHGFVDLGSDGPPLSLSSSSSNRLSQLPAQTVQPRSWVTVTVPAKEVKYGSSAKMLPPPEKDPYADFDKEDADDDENPHHIFMSADEAARGAVATWKTGAEAGADEWDDDDDDNSPKYGTTVKVNPRDARTGAYVRYVMGGPPDAQQSDAAKAAEAAAEAKAAEEAALDAEPLLRPPKIACSDRNKLGLDPPPCAVAPAAPTVEEEDDDVYD
jgi:hypothetical protein